jgi:hypothetical protein
MGGIKPWQNPYRSVVLQQSTCPLAGRNILLIENAVAILAGIKEAMPDQFTGSYDAQALAEYRLLDKELISQTGATGSVAIFTGIHPSFHNSHIYIERSYPAERTVMEEKGGWH